MLSHPYDGIDFLKMIYVAGVLECGSSSGGVRRREVLGGGPGLVGGGVGDLEHPGDVPDQRGGRFRNGGIQWQWLALHGQNLSEINLIS